jgi:hypothetical protein
MSTRATPYPDDAPAGLEREVRTSGGTPEVVATSVGRPDPAASRSATLSRFRVAPADFGLRDGLRLDVVEGLLDHVEGPRRRVTIVGG